MDKKTRLKPTCREVHRLVSEGMDRELSLVERLRMRVHLMVCGACTRFNGQMGLLRTAMRGFPLDLDAPPPAPPAPSAAPDGSDPHRH